MCSKNSTFKRSPLVAVFYYASLRPSYLTEASLFSNVLLLIGAGYQPVQRETNYILSIIAGGTAKIIIWPRYLYFEVAGFYLSMKKIILKGPRVTLRPYQLSDALTFFRWFKDKEVIKYLGAPPPKSLKDEEKFVRKNQRRKNGNTFAVLNESGRLIGSAGIGFDGGVATLGILVGEKKEWNKGYGTEIIKVLTRFGFDDKKIHRVQLKVATENKRAIKAYQKAGFTIEGTIRQAMKNPVLKRFDDEHEMSILRSEWKINK